MAVDYDLISVIVPIYNVEIFLPRCVDSLLAQTYHYILPQYIEHFMSFPEAPFVAGGYLDSAGWKMETWDTCMSVIEYKSAYTRGLQRIPSVHVAGNRYLYDVIRANNIRFEEGCICGEDSRFNVAFFSCIDRLYSTKNCEYIYCIHENSAVNSYISSRLELEREECEIREKLFLPSDEFNAIKYLHWHTTLEHCYKYYKDEKYKADSKSGLNRAVRDPYFRKCIPYMIKHGTIDMKLEGLSLGIGSFHLYKWILKAVLSSRKKD